MLHQSATISSTLSPRVVLRAARRSGALPSPPTAAPPTAAPRRAGRAAAEAARCSRLSSRLLFTSPLMPPPVLPAPGCAAAACPTLFPGRLPGGDAVGRAGKAVDAAAATLDPRASRRACMPRAPPCPCTAPPPACLATEVCECSSPLRIALCRISDLLERLLSSKLDCVLAAPGAPPAVASVAAWAASPGRPS